MSPLYAELRSILECDIDAIKKGKSMVTQDQTLIQLNQDFDLLIHRPLNALETTLVKRWLEKNAKVMEKPESLILTDPDGFKSFETTLSFPITLWRILYKESYDEVNEILGSTFESDRIIQISQQESVVLVSNNAITPFELHGTLESEALTSVKVIIGNKVTKASDLYTSYRLIVEITELAQLLKQKSQVVTYEALLFPMLIKQLKRSGSSSNFAHIRPVVDLELEQTALVFFDNNLNITETANDLFIHRNTLIYRLNKLEGITGYDIRKFNDAINYYLSYLSDKIN
jgi:hypothetical protein